MHVMLSSNCTVMSVFLNKKIKLKLRHVHTRIPKIINSPPPLALVSHHRETYSLPQQSKHPQHQKINKIKLKKNSLEPPPPPPLSPRLFLELSLSSISKPFLSSTLECESKLCLINESSSTHMNEIWV